MFSELLFKVPTHNKSKINKHYYWEIMDNFLIKCLKNKVEIWILKVWADLSIPVIYWLKININNKFLFWKILLNYNIFMKMI